MRRSSATVRLSVAQEALWAEASGTKGKLLRKGYENEVVVGDILK